MSSPVLVKWLSALLLTNLVASASGVVLSAELLPCIHGNSPCGVTFVCHLCIVGLRWPGTRQAQCVAVS